jgi:hypothetical protein
LYQNPFPGSIPAEGQFLYQNSFPGSMPDDLDDLQQFDE